MTDPRPPEARIYERDGSTVLYLPPSLPSHFVDGDEVNGDVVDSYGETYWPSRDAALIHLGQCLEAGYLVRSPDDLELIR